MPGAQTEEIDQTILAAPVYTLCCLQSVPLGLHSAFCISSPLSLHYTFSALTQMTKKKWGKGDLQPLWSTTVFVLAAVAVYDLVSKPECQTGHYRCKVNSDGAFSSFRSLIFRGRSRIVDHDSSSRTSLKVAIFPDSSAASRW